MAFIGPNGTRCSFGECDNRTESPTFGGVVPRQYSSGGKQKLFPGTHFAALLDISHPFMQDLPNYATEPMGNGPDGGLIAEAAYRSWLDAVGTGVAMQQKLMRHSDIRTTMNLYGDVVTDEMREAHSKVVRMALARA
jgi:hypothetical protein